MPAGTAVLAQEFDLPVAITTDGEWSVSEVTPGAAILEYRERIAPFTRGVLILSSTPVGAETLDEWAAEREKYGVTLEERQETQVSGYDTVVYDLTYDGDGDIPILTATINQGRIVVREAEHYRVWVIDIGAEKPLVVFSATLRDDLDWFEHANRVVDSMQIG